MNTSEILQHLNIDVLNGMQQEMHKACRKHNDIVLLSPTGSGKTLAYLIPLVQFIDSRSDNVQLLILVPSRELAIQTASVLKQMNCGVRGLAVYGGRPAMDEHRSINGIKPQVIIGTPGRVLDHLTKENFSVQYITRLVIDEFDKSLELGFQDEMSRVMSHLHSLESHILLSATDCPEIPHFVSSSTDVLRLNYLDNEDNNPERIEVFKVHSRLKDKLDCLSQLLCDLGQQSSLIFVGFRESVERTTKYLSHQGFCVAPFHGGMDQLDRERSLFRFTSGACNIMVCTDLASRGLDIPHIDNVIHYHLPLDEQVYVHRNGRTARWDAVGSSYIILGPEEYLPDFISKDIPDYDLSSSVKSSLSSVPQPKWESLYIGRGKKDKLSKGDIVGFMIKIGGLSCEEVGRIDVHEHCSYVSVLRTRVRELLLRIRGQKIKGMKTIIEPTR